MLDSEIVFRNARSIARELGLCKTDPRLEPKPKRVSFRESENDVVYLSRLNDSNVWYSKEEIKEMKIWVDMASMGVTDACGDVDIVDRIAECRGAILEAQRQSEEDLDRLSELHSEESMKVARLHAIILAHDVSMEGNPVTKEALCDIIYRAMLEGDDDDGSYDETMNLCVDETIEDDSDSIGTIDEWPLETSEPIDDPCCECDAIQRFRKEDHQSRVSVELDVSLFTTGREGSQQSSTGANQIASMVDNEMKDEKLIEHSEAPISPSCQGSTESSELSLRRKYSHHVNCRNIVKPPLSGLLPTSDVPTPESSTKSQHEEQSDQPVMKRGGLFPGVADTKRTMTGKRSRATGKEQFLALSPCSKRTCRGLSAPTKQNTDFGPEVAQALITLARWEFRSCHLPLQS